MRLLSLLSVLFYAGLNAEAAGETWFVAVYGEHFQHVTGASATAEVSDGEFLNVVFVGKEMYVRTEEHYELDEFRRNTPNGNVGSPTAAESESASDTARSSAQEPVPTSEFGPLVDTGLQYVVDGDFRGWYCAQLYVKPLGGRTYRLRCETNMKHD